MDSFVVISATPCLIKSIALWGIAPILSVHSAPSISRYTSAQKFRDGMYCNNGFNVSITRGGYCSVIYWRKVSQKDFDLVCATIKNEGGTHNVEDFQHLSSLRIG